MKKKLSLAILGLLSLAAQAREIRTPLSITSRGYNHYPLPWPVCEDDRNWAVNFFGIGLHRDTDRAFGNKNTTDTESLAALYFGLPSFTISAAFAPGTVFPTPLATIAAITPSFDYSENTAIMGFDVGTSVGCGCEWNIGVRAHVPFRAIKVTLDDCCDLVESIGSLGLTQFDRILDPVSGTIETVQVYAYRMDFVSALAQQQAGVLSFTPFVDYSATPLTMNGQDVTNDNDTDVNGGSGTGMNDGRPIQVIGAAVGTIPVQFGSLPSGVPAALPANGTLAPGAHAYFDSTTSYAPLGASVPNQSALWLTSVVIDDPSNPGTLIQTEVSDNVFSQLNTLAQTALPVPTFLAVNGLTFASQRRYQVGDLDAEFYLNRYWCNWFTEGVIGARFPTGRDITAAQLGNLLIAQTPTGNNRHFELHLGGIVGWDPIDWCAIKVDGYFNYAFNRTESVPAPFAGATINNIGTPVNAKVNWWYVVGDIDFTFMPPCICPELGIDVGYQIYVKGKDHIGLQQTAAIPFAGGTSAMLDATVLQARTFRMSHKAKLELFYQAQNWQIYGGFTHTFAGQNITRDTDTYLGMAVYF